ncbi:hypothetical protein [Mycoplasmopsis agassizii]|uniref:Lipoprotein n=1 Tax=Mycoplasmopsis agassizii TaxID=33922 RepID=A0ABX4H4K1_9BACT|nr:hypothetical protein [Mycoplasmopsis agassizii]PAF54806.1 hypothetical protein CJF60_03660 [Mycoplasmopsis agassizii]SMC19291.1 hypothetical protein SAMN02745179_00874 [Mycoplasmopsis agassizii]
MKITKKKIIFILSTVSLLAVSGTAIACGDKVVYGGEPGVDIEIFDKFNTYTLSDSKKVDYFAFKSSGYPAIYNKSLDRIKPVIIYNSKQMLEYLQNWRKSMVKYYEKRTKTGSPGFPLIDMVQQLDKYIFAMKDKFTDDFFAEKIIIFDYGNNASARVIVDKKDYREKGGEIVNLDNLEVKGKDITFTYYYKDFQDYQPLKENQHVENYGIVYSLNKKDFNINGDGYQVKKLLYDYSEQTPIEKRNLKINSALSQNLHLNTETSVLKWFKTEVDSETESYFAATHIKEKSEFEALLNSFIEGYKKDYQKDFSEAVKK